MPAERTRGSKRKAADEGISLTWTTPVDPSTPQNIAFAPNVTPGTFNDPPSPTDYPADGLLFPPSAESASSNRRTGHSKKKPENHIPRPPNAFILFRSSFIKNQHVSSEVETNHSTLSKIIGLTWQNLPDEERQIWHAKAKAAVDEHKRKFPQYAFRPLHTKGRAATEKRKVREVGPKDMKRCAKIAELLVEGKKGPDLDAAIAEFDRHHVPEIVTRFEAPITARTFRRSSSAPVPDSEGSTPSFLPATPTERKFRATSTQPGTPRTEPSSDWDVLSSSPSQFDVDSASEYYCDSPSSPSLPPRLYPLPVTNPSFDFSTFTFNATSASPTQHVDPFACESPSSPFDVFSQAPDTPCTPGNDVFDPASLTIDTSFFDNFTAASSPFSSMPSTPHAYPDVQSSLRGDGDCMPPLVDNPDGAFNFFSDISHFPEEMSTLLRGNNATQFLASDYCSVPKPEYSLFYERSGLAPLNGHIMVSANYHPAVAETFAM